MSRWSDWKLKNSCENKKLIIIIINTWGNDDTLGSKFVENLESPSCVTLDYDKKRKVMYAAAKAYMENSDSDCEKCFGIGSYLKLGWGCCGNRACTDICTAKIKKCKLCKK